VKVLAIDPGRRKCGIAVCGPGEVLVRRVVPTGGLIDVAREWVRAHRVDVVVVGRSTGAPQVMQGLEGLSVPIVQVDELGTTLAARARYFQDHPPRGWRRLVPRSFLVPPEPYDDYAAVVLAEAYLSGRGNAVGSPPGGHPPR